MNQLILRVGTIIFTAFVLILLYFSSLYNYLLFHTIAEIFSICIAFTVFAIAWSSMEYISNNYLRLIGIAYFFIGILDLFHTMGYKGMQIFTDYDYYANQLWIAARYFESIILLISFTLVKSEKKVNAYILFGICTVITAFILLSIFVWKVFPICFIEGMGLTGFKKISELIICFILVLSMLILSQNKDAFEGIVYKFLIASMTCTIISELAFTIYIDNYGLSNLIGHYFKIFSFYLIYKTIVVKGIKEPYEIIFREIKQTQQQLFEQNRILKNQANIDGLTGLYNHRYIYERLEEEAQRCSRNNSRFVILMLDIDHFKRINDTHGHLLGDKILKELAMILKEGTRQTDLVGRYGGEEFLIMLTETNAADGYLAAEKIRKTIEQTAFTEGIHLTVSIGVGEYSGERTSEFLEKADNKLYLAKKSGRNQTAM
ncbi:MAG: GGDEF domain-containing protein [Bacillota bacterium]